MRVALVLALGLGLGWPAPARADDAWRRVQIDWSIPEGCPASPELRRLVTARLPQDAVVRARGRVERAADRFRLDLDIETASGHGQRSLEAPTCEGLASAAAIVIAISAAPAVSAVEPPTAPVEPLEPREAAPSRFLARAQVIDDSGTLPSLGLGGGLAFGVRIARDVRLEANASAFGAQDGRVAGSVPPRGASFSLLSAGVRGCWSLTRPIELAPCLGIDVARLAGRGFGAVRNEDAVAVIFSPEALLALFFPIAGPVGLRAGVGLGLPMSRQSFVITSAGSVHRPAVVAVRAWLGPEVRF